MSDTEKSVWMRGYLAAQDAAVGSTCALFFDDNPYEENDPKHSEWDDGYRAGWYDEYPENEVTEDTP